MGRKTQPTNQKSLVMRTLMLKFFLARVMRWRLQVSCTRSSATLFTSTSASGLVAGARNSVRRVGIIDSSTNSWFTLQQSAFMITNLFVSKYTRTCQCGHMYTAANLPIRSLKVPIFTCIHDTKLDTKTTCPLRPF